MADNPFQKELTRRANPFRQRMQAQAPRETPSTAEAVGRGALQGATLLWADELMNLNPWAPGAGSRMRQRDEEVREARPGAFMAGEMAGGLVTGGVGATRAAAGTVGRAAIGRVAGSSAAVGGVAGVGAGEDNKVASGAVGAVAGGTIGAALPGMGVAIRKVARYLNPKDPLNATERAAKLVAQDLEQSVSLPAASKALRENPNMTVADLSPQLQQRLSAAARQSPKIARQARDQLEARQVGQAGRLTDEFKKTLKDVPTLRASEMTRKRMQAGAKPLYDEAYKTPIEPSESMMAVLDTPMGKWAAKRASDQIRNKTGALPQKPAYVFEDMRYAVDKDVRSPLAQQGKPTIETDVTNLQFWDELQRALGDKAYGAKLTDPDLSRTAGRLKQRIVGETERQSPAWGQARTIWRDEMADLEAMELADKVFTSSTGGTFKLNNLRAEIGKMSDSEKWHFRAAVFEKLDDLISKKGEGDKLSGLFKSRKMQEAVRIAMDDKNAYTSFRRVLGDEAKMEETLRRIRLRSLLDDDGSVMGRFGTAAASGSGLQFNAGMLSAAGNMIQAPGRERRNRLIGETLLGRNPENLSMQLAQRARSPRVPPGSVSGGLAAVLAGQGAN